MVAVFQFMIERITSEEDVHTYLSWPETTRRVLRCDSLMLELKVNQVMSLGNGMVRLLLVRPGLKTRIEPINQTEEQRMAQSIASQMQQAMGTAFPGAVIVGGAPGGSQWDARIDMQITEEEYQQLGKPGINDTIRIEINKATQ